MLVLTRKQQEKINIGENITITVVRIKGNTVRVGIEAPREIRVMRGEVDAKEPAASDDAPLASGTQPSEDGETRTDVGSGAGNDMPSAPWQRVRNERRGPLPVPSRGAWAAEQTQRDSLPAYAV